MTGDAFERRMSSGWWPLRLGRPGLRSWKSLVFVERGLRSGASVTYMTV